MEHFDTTSNFISNHVNSSGYTAGDVIKTYGYSSLGGVGGSRWKATGNTIAASQDPLALNDIKMSDASGNEFELMVEESGVIDLNVLGGTSAAYENIAINAGLIYAQGLSPTASSGVRFVADYVELDALLSGDFNDGDPVVVTDVGVIGVWYARTGSHDPIEDKRRTFGNDAGRYWERKIDDFSSQEFISTGRRVASLFENTDVKLFAHRELDYTEWNTISEFSYGLSQGADGLEIDIQRTSDGTLVLWHDSDLNTRTDGSGSIQSNTLAQVRAARFTSLIGTAYEDEQIATLDELFTLVRESGTMVIAEVKNFGTQQEKDDTVDETVQLAMDYGIIEQTFFSAFNDDLIKRAITYNNKINIIKYFTTPTTASYDSMNNFDNFGMRIVGADRTGGGLTKANVDYGRNINVGTATFTTKSEDQIKDAKNLGVNIIITDRLSSKLGGKG